MAKLRALSGSDLLSIFALFGFTPFTQRGSHVKPRHVTLDGSRQTLTIVAHREVDKGTLAAIYQQAPRYIPEEHLRPYFFTEQDVPVKIRDMNQTGAMWRLALGAVLLAPVALMVWTLGHEAKFEYAMWKYSHAFKPGMARQQVEERLHADGAQFYRSSLADSIELGSVRRKPWCAPIEMSVSIQFDPKDVKTAGPTDEMRAIRLLEIGGGC